VIPFSRSHVTREDIEAVADTLRQGFVSRDATIVGDFEQAFDAAVRRNHGIAVASGSLARNIAHVQHFLGERSLAIYL